MKKDVLSQSELESLLQTLHDGFDERLAAALSPRMRTDVRAEPTGIEQLNGAELLRSLESPTYVATIQADSLPASVLLEIRSAILGPMIDRLLGGAGNGPTGPLTDIELRLASQVADAIVQELSATWAASAGIEPRLSGTETDPKSVSVTAGETIAVLSFELSTGTARGTLRLAIPEVAIEPLTANLAEPEFPSVEDSTVVVEVPIAHTQISTADLADLRVGDIITTEQRIDLPLNVLVNGVPKFHARPGVADGRKAVSIEGEIDESE